MDTLSESYVPIGPQHDGQTVNVRWEENDDDVHGDVALMGTRVVGGIYRISDGGTKGQRAIGHNEYAEEEWDVPNGAMCDSLSPFQYNHFCRDPVPEPDFEGQGLELYKWIQGVREQCLTIADVVNFAPGQQVKVLHMDRNVGDVVCETNAGNQLFQPSEFFADVTAMYTHKRDLRGTIKYSWEETEQYRGQEASAFEFDIEYKHDYWYPLKEGCLPANDPQGLADFGHSMPKSWREFPSDTRVGWRGPMLLWNKVDDQPNVYWYDSNHK